MRRLNMPRGIVGQTPSSGKAAGGVGPVVDLGGPLASITFDNNGLTPKTVAMPMMQAYGFRGTWYPTSASNFHPSSGACTVADLLAWVAAGNEIGSHTVNHIQLNTVDDATKTSECADSKTAIIAAGLGVPRSIAYPVGTYDAATLAVVRQYYDYGLAIPGCYNLDSEARYAVRRMGRALSLTQAPWDDVKNMLIECAGRTGFFVYYTHGVEVDQYCDTVEMFAELLSLLRQYNYQVLPVSQAMDFWKARVVPTGKNLLVNGDFKYLDLTTPNTYPFFRFYQGTDANAICSAVQGTGMHIATAVAYTATFQYVLNSIETPQKRDVTYRFSADVVGTVTGGSGVRVTVEGAAGWTAVNGIYQTNFTGTRTVTVDFTIPAAQTVLPNKLKFVWNGCTGDAMVQNFKLVRV